MEDDEARQKIAIGDMMLSSVVVCPRSLIGRRATVGKESRNDLHEMIET
jgi:hypothetical protein